MKMEQTERSETSTYEIQTPGNYPEEIIQHSQHGESLESRICVLRANGAKVGTWLVPEHKAKV
jgi:hypothetical protein